METKKRRVLEIDPGDETKKTMMGRMGIVAIVNDAANIETTTRYPLTILRLTSAVEESGEKRTRSANTRSIPSDLLEI
jgi:hypothetical protein